MILNVFEDVFSNSSKIISNFQKYKKRYKSENNIFHKVKCDLGHMGCLDHQFKFEKPKKKKKKEFFITPFNIFKNILGFGYAYPNAMIFHFKGFLDTRIRNNLIFYL